MHAENIYVQVHCVPLHYHPYFQEEYGYERGQFPVTEQYTNASCRCRCFRKWTTRTWQMLSRPLCGSTSTIETNISTERGVMYVL